VRFLGVRSLVVVVRKKLLAQDDLGEGNLNALLFYLCFVRPTMFDKKVDAVLVAVVRR
jgi:hypothetical protein